MKYKWCKYKKSYNLYNSQIIEKKILYICTNEYGYFFNKPNVVGVGMGYKVKSGFCTFQKCIKVFTSNKILESKLCYKDIIPKLYKGIKTDVIESGVFHPLELKDKIRPTLGGYGISPSVVQQGAGTLGCLVTDENHNYILGNNHVLANTNNLPLASPIIQPANIDGGNPNKDIIAILSKYIPLKFVSFLYPSENKVDCAIAKVVDKSLVSSKIALVGTPKGVISPQLYRMVRKVGRTTELTEGKVVAINSTFKTEYQTSHGGRKAVFKNQIITNCMSTYGDSGAVLLDSNNYVMGLLIGGTDGYSVFNDIRDVLGELKVKIITN